MSDGPPKQEPEDNDEPRLMTSIDGEEVRLLVHIEPLDDDGSEHAEARGTPRSAE